jgi:NADPH2 dehydrogenase
MFARYTSTKMSRLFEPVNLGTSKLGHRLAMAPLTRYRSSDDWVPLPIMKGE